MSGRIPQSIVRLLTFGVLLVLPGTLQAATSRSEQYQIEGVTWPGAATVTSQRSDNYQLSPDPTESATTSTTPTPDVGETQAGDGGTIQDPTTPTPKGTGDSTGSAPQPTAVAAESEPAGQSIFATLLPPSVAELRTMLEPALASPAVRTSQSAVNVTAAVTSALALAAPLAANAPLLSPLGQLIAWIGTLGRPRRRPWGVVRDAESNQPIGLALVRLLRGSDGKLVGTTQTDQAGRFSLVAAPGSYILEIAKLHYTFPSKLQTSGYHGAAVTLERQSELNLEVYLDPNLTRLRGRLGLLHRIEQLGHLMQPSFLAVGAAFAVLYAVVQPSPIHLATLAAYALILGVLFVRRLTHHVATARVIDATTQRGIELSIVRLFDERSRHLVATRVTDHRGELFLSVAPGSYHATATHPRYQRYQSAPWEERGRSVGLRRDFSVTPLAAAVANAVHRALIEGVASRRTLTGGVIVERGPDFSPAKSGAAV